ncbi:MAG: hypothetical protein KC561_11255 [Myxococcales bacterium]|nr:hypothetical protein [Myxococcales bacterium]
MSEAQDDQLLNHRIVYSMLVPAIRVGLHVGLPLKDLTNLLQLAAFQILRDKSDTLDTIADIMSVSKRTAARLSRRLKTEFFDPDREHDLPRQIEFLLWSTPLSRVKLRQALRELDPVDVDAALDNLLSQGRVRLTEGRTPIFEVVRSAERLPRDDWRARIGGLNSLMTTVADTVRGRFFKSDQSSFARTLIFRASPEGLERLRKLYEETIWPVAREIEEETGSSSDAAPISMSVLWSSAPADQENDDD